MVENIKDLQFSYEWLIEEDRAIGELMNSQGLNAPTLSGRVYYIDHYIGHYLLEQSEPLLRDKELNEEELLTLKGMEMYYGAVGRVVWGAERYDRIRADMPKQWEESTERRRKMAKKILEASQR